MLKVIIVDDEALARSEIRFLLNQTGQVEVTAEAASVREAIEKLKEHPCDGVFLDISMPEATGLQLAAAFQRLKRPPGVVFVTAYSEYALDAFRVNAVDYLLKPIETKQLVQAITRMQEYAALHMPAEKTESILVEENGKKTIVGADEVCFFLARGDCAYLQTETGRYLTMASLAQLEKRLGCQGFFRVHRSYLVNLSKIEEIEPAPRGSSLLTLSGVDEKVPVSCRRVSELIRALSL